MKIAIPVKDENLTFFGNAGHTPKFAIFNMNGTGMFKSFKLDSVKNNPRTDLDHEHAEEEHQCNHSADDAEHIAQHNKMGVVLEGCDYIVVTKACKNTANAITSHGVKILKYSGESLKADSILKEMSSQFLK
ncbi:MAG: hypothetical protein WC667_08310 [Sulfurimonas sp.]|jgi:predicted Fe-Mo cluster-binding NifX family protein